MEQLSFGWYLPLVVAGLVYVVLFMVGRVLRGRGETETADRLLDIAFLVVLAVAAYTALLLVLSLVTFPSRIASMLFIMIIVGAFFLLLLLVLFGLFELLAASRAAAPQQREPAGGEPVQPS